MWCWTTRRRRASLDVRSSYSRCHSNQSRGVSWTIASCAAALDSGQSGYKRIDLLEYLVLHFQVPDHLRHVDEDEELRYQENFYRRHPQMLKPLADAYPDREVVGLTVDQDREGPVSGDDGAEEPTWITVP